jgi:hypothetical protein
MRVVAERPECGLSRIAGERTGDRTRVCKRTRVWMNHFDEGTRVASGVGDSRGCRNLQGIDMNPSVFRSLKRYFRTDFGLPKYCTTLGFRILGLYRVRSLKRYFSDGFRTTEISYDVRVPDFRVVPCVLNRGPEPGSRQLVCLIEINSF